MDLSLWLYATHGLRTPKPAAVQRSASPTGTKPNIPLGGVVKHDTEKLKTCARQKEENTADRRGPINPSSGARATMCARRLDNDDPNSSWKEPRTRRGKDHNAVQQATRSAIHGSSGTLFKPGCTTRRPSPRSQCNTLALSEKSPRSQPRLPHPC